MQQCSFASHERLCIRPLHWPVSVHATSIKGLLMRSPAQALGVDVAKRLEIMRVEEPPKRQSGVRVASVAELVDKLHNEAKVV